MEPIEFETHIHKLSHMVGMHYLEIPQDIVAKLGGGYSKRLIVTVNQQMSFHGGLVALGNGDAYISINVSRLKKMALRSGDKVFLRLEEDLSEYGMEVPEELEELLRQDDEGMRRFRMLTAGKQRYIIHYVSSVKSSHLRLERALLLIENLKKLPVGKEQFREMLGKEKR